jgi:hypothetical protein
MDIKQVQQVDFCCGAVVVSRDCGSLTAKRDPERRAATLTLLGSLCALRDGLPDGDNRHTRRS